MTTSPVGTAVENREFAAFGRRIIRAHARRVAASDPTALRDLVAMRAALDEAIDHAAVELRGTGWTFQGQMRDGRAIHGDRSAGHLSAGRVGELVSELLPDGWTTHTLRHRFASAAYRADRDIRAVQELLGHVSRRDDTGLHSGARRRQAPRRARGRHRCLARSRGRDRSWRTGS